VKRLESLTLTGHSEGEVAESVGHAKQVRDVIAILGAEAVTSRDRTPIIHAKNARVMLQEALKTEATAADVYRKIVPLVKDNTVFFHTLSPILMDEMKAVAEMETLLGRSIGRRKPRGPHGAPARAALGPSWGRARYFASTFSGGVCRARATGTRFCSGSAQGERR
jgi:bacterioferritin (cytochrome b1)